jgi:hypothetical protein
VLNEKLGQHNKPKAAVHSVELTGPLKKKKKKKKKPFVIKFYNYSKKLFFIVFDKLLSGVSKASLILEEGVL